MNLLQKVFLNMKPAFVVSFSKVVDTLYCVSLKEV